MSQQKQCLRSRWQLTSHEEDFFFPSSSSLYALRHALKQNEMKKNKNKNFSSTAEVLFRHARCSQPSKSLMRFIADLSDACGLADKTSVNTLHKRIKKKSFERAVSELFTVGNLDV